MEFNVNSTPQLREVLFEKLGLAPVKKTKTGLPDADSLQKMVEEHPIVEDLLRYREVEKLRSTYAEALPPLIGDDGRIPRPSSRPTTTGRISARTRTSRTCPCARPTGRRCAAFIADEGCGLLTADYSQIELRVLAHLTDDPGLIEAFSRSADIHTTTAAMVFGVEEKDVDAFQRRFAKVVNFGLAYGMEAYGLGQRLGVPTEEAREILDNYFAELPEREGVHGQHRAGGEAARLHDDDLRPSASDHRAVVRQLPHPSDGGAHGAERLCRAPLPTCSNWRWSSSTARSTAPASGPACPHRPRRARARSAARRRGGSSRSCGRHGIRLR